MVLQHNLLSMNTSRSLGVVTNKQAKSSEKLSSGYRINRSADDAAGLSISEKLRGQIRGLDQATTNAQDGISLLQTAEGAMSEIHNTLQRIRELYIQNCNDTNIDEDREAIWEESTALYSEINRIAHETEFNHQKFLDGSYATYPGAGGAPEEGTRLNLQVGANSNQSMSITIPDFTTDGSVSHSDYDIFAPLVKIGTTSVGYSLSNYLEQNNIQAKEYFMDPYGLDFGGHVNQTMILGGIDYAIRKVSDARADVGASNNRLEHIINNNLNSAENLQASESRIRDVNMADEMVSYAKQNILIQAGQSMLAQANSMPNQILTLLQ